MYDKFKAGPWDGRLVGRRAARPDSLVFFLHYRVTFLLLWVAAVMVTSVEYIDSGGSAIQCMQDVTGDEATPVPGDILNSFCWIMSTYTVSGQGRDWPHEGVGPVRAGEEVVRHAYYQWVPFMLFLQGVCFYLPHWVWKQLEGGMMENLVGGLERSALEGESSGRVDQLAAYMHQRMEFSWDNRLWAAKFYFCEFLNFVNICAQIKLTDFFLGNAFLDYGIAAATWSRSKAEERSDPMITVFPRMTKCHFNMFGPSGTVQKTDALCVLGMNILNEKIYVFLWFWFLLLAAVTAGRLLVRLVPLLVPSTQLWGSYNMAGLADRLHLRPADWGSWAERRRARQLLGRLTYADWLLVEHLGHQLGGQELAQLVQLMAAREPEEEGQSTRPSSAQLHRRRTTDSGVTTDL
jgi:hypothetical protein